MINLKNIFRKKAEPAWIVPTGTTIDGDMNTPSALRVDGTVVGNIYAGERLIIGPGGQVRGNIDGGYIMVQGKVLGNITGGTKVFITETATIEGLIHTPEKDIQEGAVVKEVIGEPLPVLTAAEVSEPVAAVPEDIMNTVIIAPSQQAAIVEHIEKIWTPVRPENNNTWF